MPEEEEREGKELREEAPVYFERYQQAREEFLAAELRRLEEAIGHNADRIRDFREDVDRRLVELRSHIDQHFDESDRRIDARFVAVDQRFTAVDQRFTAVDQRFDAVDQQFESLERQLDHRFESVNQRFDAVDQRFESLERQLDHRFESVNQRFDAVDQRFESLERQMDHRFQDMKAGLQRSDRWTQVFFGTTLAFLVAILALLVTLLIR
ncbi:MAG: hypothetical protein ACE5LU_06205 [Anaerolineae bacterium]